MIEEKEVLHIGRLCKLHGKQGEMVLVLSTDTFALSSPTWLILSLDSIWVPFRIREMRQKNSEAVIVLLDSVDSEKRALRLCGSEAYMLRKEVSEEAEEEVAVEDLVGWTIVDTAIGDLGKIVEVDTSTLNTLLLLEGDKVIPYHDDFFVAINEEEHILTLHLPEGIL